MSRVLEKLPVGLPVRVLYSVHELQRPELPHIAGIGVISLVNLVFGDIISPREQVCGHERVVIKSLDGRVALVLSHVASADIKDELVFNELRRVAD